MIELKNGLVIECILNGNNYITQQEIKESDLSDLNLIGVKIDGVEYSDLTCCNFFKDEDGTHIIFRQYSHEEIERQKLNAKIEYLAMMGGIELDYE